MPTCVGMTVLYDGRVGINTGHAAAHAEALVAPALCRQHLPQCHGHVPNVTVAKGQWCDPEPENVRRAEIPDDTTFDQRLDNCVGFWMAERDLAAT